MSNTQSDEAIVIKKIAIRSDDVVVLLTKQYGKVSAIAKGTRSLLSKRTPHLQTGNYIRVYLRSHHDVWYVQQSELISGFSSLKTDIAKLNGLYALLFLLDHILPQEQAETQVFQAMLTYVTNLHHLDSSSAHMYSIQAMATIVRELGFPISSDVSSEHIIAEIEDIIGEKIPQHTV